VNFEDGGFVARAAAFFADKFDVGEKLHFDGDVPSPWQVSQRPPGNVERKWPAV